jgi:putative flavoprotein involved in K+ transport
MLQDPPPLAAEQVEAWISAFGRALSANDEASLERLFEPDSHWRNLCGLSWQLATFSGRERLCRELCRSAAEVKASGFRIDPAMLAPRQSVVAGRNVIEAIFRFETANGPGLGVVRLAVSGPGVLRKAWMLSTTLDMDAICEAKTGRAASQSHERDFSERGWLAQRKAESAYRDREPDVLVVGGGHAGISAAVELKRIGDNWRLRYNGLKLHNKTPVNHLRYMPFPPTWPDYIPKDKIANWLESYVDAMEVNFWTRTTFEKAEYDASAQLWTATVRLDDGSVRCLRPRHIVLATSVSSVPIIPKLETIENFGGPVLHSSRFTAGADWTGKSVVVFGTGTSAHDICQELQAHGARATMVQRSPTMVVNVDPSAQLYDKVYLGDGPPLEVRDLLNSSVALPVTKVAHRLITDQVKKLDAPLLDRLEKVGFRLEFGEDGTGWPLKFRTRGGGYYFNVGCSELIAERKIRLIQSTDIRRFTADGLELSDGLQLKADLVVLATGYRGQEHIVSSRFGTDVAERVGPIWGFNDDTQELRNMWTRTKQPGLWFTGGSFSQCRIYSRYIALQIDAIESGRLAKAA